MLNYSQCETEMTDNAQCGCGINFSVFYTKFAAHYILKQTNKQKKQSKSSSKDGYEIINFKIYSIVITAEFHCPLTTQNLVIIVRKKRAV